MAFANPNGMVTRVSQNDETGLWAIHESSDQYRAWRYWLWKEFGMSGFSRWITTIYEWPPSSQLAANRYAEYFSKLRDENKNPTPVPRNPEAWDGHIPPADHEKQERYIDAKTMRATLRRYGYEYLLAPVKEAAQ